MSGVSQRYRRRSRSTEMDNPFRIFDDIRQAYLRYLDSPFRLRYDALLSERRALLDQDRQLYRRPLFEPITPYELCGETVTQVAARFGLSAEVAQFITRGLFRPDPQGNERELYRHQ